MQITGLPVRIPETQAKQTRSQNRRHQSKPIFTGVMKPHPTQSDTVRFSGNGPDERITATLAVLKDIASATPETLESVNPLLAELLDCFPKRGERRYTQRKADLIKTSRLLLRVLNEWESKGLGSPSFFIEKAFLNLQPYKSFAFANGETSQHGRSALEELRTRIVKIYSDKDSPDYDPHLYSERSRTALVTLDALVKLSAMPTEPEAQAELFKQWVKSAHILYDDKARPTSLFFQKLPVNTKILLLQDIKKIEEQGLLDDAYNALSANFPDETRWQVINQYHATHHYEAAFSEDKPHWQQAHQTFERAPLFEKFKADVDRFFDKLAPEIRLELTNYATDKAFLAFALEDANAVAEHEYESSPGFDPFRHERHKRLARNQQAHLEQITDPMMQAIFKVQIFEDAEAIETLLAQRSENWASALNKQIDPILALLPNAPTSNPFAQKSLKELRENVGKLLLETKRLLKKEEASQIISAYQRTKEQLIHTKSAG